MIVLISDTPVAGTVDRLGEWIEKISGIKTITLVKRNYPHHAFELKAGVFGCLPNWENYIASIIAQATCIILHNVLDEKVINIVFKEKKSNTSVLYQLHSPPLEGPQFTYEIISKYKFDGILSVSQGHGRFFQNSIPVPNIVPDFHLHNKPEKEDLLFIPHIRTTNFKWSNKFSPENAQVLESGKKFFKSTKISKIKDLFGRDVVSHSEIQFALQFCTFVVDDMNTGLIHQTAIEGIKAGCGVFSGADMYTVEEYSNTIDAPEPPFIYVDNMDDVVKFLITTSGADYLIENSKKILDYSKKYLCEERIAQIYFEKLAIYVS